MTTEIDHSTKKVGQCPIRHLCLVPTSKGPKPMSELDMKCGFEQAGTVEGCPKVKKHDA